MRFVKLTGADGEPRWMQADAIIDMRQFGDGTGEKLTCISALGGYAPAVRETPDQILALLDAAQEGEVTDEAAMAAINYLGQVYPRLTKNLALLDMQAAIEAALAVMRGQR